MTSEEAALRFLDRIIAMMEADKEEPHVRVVLDPGALEHLKVIRGLMPKLEQY